MSDKSGIWERALLEQNRSWLTAYILTVTGDRSWTEDLVQEVFATAIEQARRFDPSLSLGAWLRGIAKNLLRRHQARPGQKLLPLDLHTVTVLDRVAQEAEERGAAPGEEEGRLQSLKRCLESLTDRARKALELRYGMRRASRDIGQQLGLKTAAVDMVMSRARRTLQDCISRKMRPQVDG
jgi:RNA polymerase sigma-70 factor (ECF subfamily)